VTKAEFLRSNRPPGVLIGILSTKVAVCEQRRAPLGEIQPPRIHFGQVSDELRSRVSLVRGQTLHGRQQFGIRQRRRGIERIDVHAPFYHRLFETLPDACEGRETTGEAHGEERVVSCARERRGRSQR
jgi:hypothetical protein